MEPRDLVIRQFALSMYVRGWVGLRARCGGFPVRGHDAVYMVGNCDLADCSGIWFGSRLDLCADVNFSVVIREGGRVWVGEGEMMCEVVPDDLAMFGYRLSQRQRKWGGGARVCGMIPF